MKDSTISKYFLRLCIPNLQDFVAKINKLIGGYTLYNLSIKMPTIYRCPFCNEEFYRRDLAREHIKSRHQSFVRRVLSQLSPRKMEGLKKRNIDPENWAAGWILSMF